MSRSKTVPHVSRCPSCHHAVSIDGDAFLSQPEVWAQCGKCNTEFNVPLIPGDVAPQPLRDRPTPPRDLVRKPKTPTPAPAAKTPLPPNLRPSKPPTPPVPTRQPQQPVFAPLQTSSPPPPPAPKPVAQAPKPATPVPFPPAPKAVTPPPANKGKAVPFAPLGSNQPQGQTPPPVQRGQAASSAPVPQPLSGGSKPARGGFNALPQWAQYTILGVGLVVVAVVIMVLPIGESKGGKKAPAKVPAIEAPAEQEAEAP